MSKVRIDPVELQYFNVNEMVVDHYWDDVYNAPPPRQKIKL